VPYEIDEEERALGRLVLRAHPKVDGEIIDLIVTFPDLYPETRLEIVAPNLDLPHHQNPIEKNLCLIGQATKNWLPSDTLASFIRDRLPMVLETARAEKADDVESLEEDQAEPLSVYYPINEDACIFIDGNWSIPADATSGQLLIGIGTFKNRILRGAVLEVRRSDGTIIEKIDPSVARLYSEKIDAKWVRIPAPIRTADQNQFRNQLFKQHPYLNAAKWSSIKGVKVDAIGVIFPEESTRRITSDGWIFFVQFESLGSRQSYYFAKASRIGKTDLSVRVPELSLLRDKVVTVVGLGCVGAPCVIELARAGVGELRIIDDDRVEGGTIVRWPLGLDSIGKYKVSALHEFLNENYPYTKVRTYRHRVGVAYRQPRSDRDLLPKVLKGADILLDASAEDGLSPSLARLADIFGITYLSVSTTPGGWGGQITRIRPDLTDGCWYCMLQLLKDGSIPSPPSNPAELVQPAGCSAPTFTGAEFDIEQISLTAVRIAVSTLCDGMPHAYPSTQADIQIISLRDDNGGLIPQTAQEFALTRHPKCKNHPAKSGSTKP
jgi:molybdopterin/thiamine biosynthesis adenylyltransferase